MMEEKARTRTLLLMKLEPTERHRRLLQTRPFQIVYPMPRSYTPTHSIHSLHAYLLWTAPDIALSLAASRRHIATPLYPVPYPSLPRS